MLPGFEKKLRVLIDWLLDLAFPRVIVIAGDAESLWFLGPITAMPLILGRLPTGEVAAAQAAYPSLLGHLIWGASAGIALVAIKVGGAGPISL